MAGAFDDQIYFLNKIQVHTLTFCLSLEINDCRVSHLSFNLIVARDELHCLH